VSARDIGQLTERLVMGTRDVLRGIGVAEADIEEELDHMCMVRFAASAPAGRGRGRLDGAGQALRVRAGRGGSPGALVTKSLELARALSDSQSPEEATRALFKRTRLRLVR